MQTPIGLHGHRYALVPPQEFSARMKAHWTSNLGLCSSAPLEKLWAIMAKTFNEAISDTANCVQAPWRILQPPTGSGKTRGACLFAAMQAELNLTSAFPVGSIIVTRLIDEADKLVTEINAHAGREVAIAHHSRAPKSTDVLQQHDTLVITHQACVNASASLNSSQGAAFERLRRWRGGERLLTIIDEALANVVEDVKVTANDIAEVQRYITTDLDRQFFTECVALNLLKRALGAYENQGAASVFMPGGINTPDSNLVNFASLRNEMKRIEYDRLGAHMTDAEVRGRISHKVDRTLEACQALFDQWSYYAKSGDEHSFNSSSLSVPWGAPGPVVLDATARADFLWDLFEDKARLEPTPSHVRDYSNATLHVARCAAVGKRAMIKSFKARFARLANDLEQRLPVSSSVFLCTHNANTHIAKGDGMGFERFAVGHWNAVDGRNDWADFDTAVIFGLPYRDQIWATNTFFAVQGPQTDEWLKTPTWKDHADVRRVMRQRQLAVMVIQAINRIRLRRVVDEEGRCPEASVYIVLPRDADGDAILASILADMPGLKVADWPFEMDGPKVRSPRKGSSHEALVSFMGSRLPGSTPLTAIKRELSLSDTALKKLKEALGNKEHSTTKALCAISVEYTVTGRGRGAKSYLVKHEAA
ncbi:hypothetical protein JQ616_33840 [Bradyrhizobium tropiciagri]|uniref:hypothetical protein n=1 Tax=Bradyrhizobium tropiciagri TaxID=312253 RepID=UPI001BAD74A1|nr:hypothetical protein [Bradyrhizobium tropiciagri]MBR0899961.1 hypothetical protein [Bradyrhizobium tropiciagri]